MRHFRDVANFRQPFIADCLKRQGNDTECQLAISKVRSELATNPQGLDAKSLEQLNKTADAIEAVKVGQ